METIGMVYVHEIQTQTFAFHMTGSADPMEAKAGMSLLVTVSLAFI